MIYQKVKKVRIEDKDRISKLPNTAIHHILSFLEVSIAVRTSVLSKRWYLIWTTLPSLNFQHHNYTISTGRCQILKSLNLIGCKLPGKVWDFPVLLTLQMEDVLFPDNIGDFFSALVSLQNLKLSFQTNSLQHLSISCPQLINLEIRTLVTTTCYFYGRVVVSAPKLCNFSSVGIFPIKFRDSKLENVNIRLQGWFDDFTLRQDNLYQHWGRFGSMFSKIGGAKILTLDFEALQALSAISDFLIEYPSPFYNLKYVKLPQRYRESSMSNTLRNYLLGGSPKAKIVTTLPQVQKEPLITLKKEPVDSQGMHKKVCVDAVGIGVQEDHVVGNSVVDASAVAGICGQGDSVVREFSGLVPDAPDAGADNDQASSFGPDSKFGLWQDHVVNCEFVSLLDLIMKKYPETFEQFTTKSKKFCTMKLNMLCTSVNDFMKTSITEVNTETITEYRALFAALHNLGFNVNWLASRLDYIEELRFSQPLLHELYAIDSRIQDLQTLRAEKMAEIEKAFGNMGTKLVAGIGNIGDDLLSST